MSAILSSRFNRRPSASKTLCLLMVICTFAIALCPQRTHATVITFAFTGEVDFVMDNSNLLGGSVVIGTPISGTYSFESTTPDALPSDNRFGYYPASVLDLSGLLGPWPFAGQTGPENEIGVSLLSTFHAYSTIVSASLNGALTSFSIALADDGTTLFENDALPLTPPDLETLESKGIGFVAEDIGLNVHGQLTSLALVPEPSLGLLACLTAASILRRRARETIATSQQ